MSRQTGLLLALVVSVGLNLLVAGLVIGRKGLDAPPPRPMAWAARELSPETRQLVRSHMDDSVAEVRTVRRELREAHASVRSAASAEAYDVQAMRDALARLRGVSGRYQQLLHDRLAEIGAELPADERAALLRSALQRVDGGRRSGGPGGR